jgi:CheY-like chemotaxis protein
VPAGVRVRADAMRLQQMLRNLIGNAVKFTPEGGHIRLSAEHSVQGWVIAVEDTGEGIAQEFLPHVFERFRQGDGSSTRRHGGLGVGLAVVKALAEVQHGQVRAFSDGVGQGARFEIELLALPAASTTGEQPASGWPQSLAGVRALVVDDETDSRELVCEILQRHGAQVDMAADAAAALRRRLTGRYELLVCDIAMPGMDGHELLRQWLRLEGRRPRRAIALTAFADAANRMLAEEAGYDCLLAKPVEPGELIDAASAPRITQVRAGPRLTPSRSGKTALQ